MNKLNLLVSLILVAFIGITMIIPVASILGAVAIFYIIYKGPEWNL